MKFQYYLKKFIPVILAFSIIFGLTACWDKVEVDEIALVVAIGLDKIEDNKIEVSYLLDNPQGGGFTGVIGSSPNEPPLKVITLKGVDMISGRELVGSSLIRKLSFAHVMLIVVSEDLAKSDLFLRQFDALLRERQIRRNVIIVVSKQKAAEFLKGSHAPFETRPHKYYQFAIRRWEETELVPISTVYEFIQRVEEKAGLYLCIYASSKVDNPKIKYVEQDYLPGEIEMGGGEYTQFIGSAVFKNGRQVGVLTGLETRTCYLLHPNYRSVSVNTAFPDPLDERFKISVRIIKDEDTGVKINISGDYPVIDVTVPIKVDILGIPSGIDYFFNTEYQNRLKEHIAQIMEDTANSLIIKAQEEFKGDPFMWHTVVRKKLATWDDYREYNWPEKFTKAKTSVKYIIEINRFGQETSPTNFNEVVGDKTDD